MLTVHVKLSANYQLCHAGTEQLIRFVYKTDVCLQSTFGVRSNY